MVGDTFCGGAHAWAQAGWWRSRLYSSTGVAVDYASVRLWLHHGMCYAGRVVSAGFGPRYERAPADVIADEKCPSQGARLRFCLPGH